MIPPMIVDPQVPCLPLFYYFEGAGSISYLSRAGLQDWMWVLHLRPQTLGYLLCASGMNLQQSTMNNMRVGDQVLYRRSIMNI